MNLYETRKHYGLAQAEAARIVGIPLRTYRRYESDDDYGDSLKRSALISRLNEECEITEEKGLLTIEWIRGQLRDLFANQYKGKVRFCYLFGSYARGNPKPESDVDIYVSSSLGGIGFLGLMERVRERLRKKVDVIRDSELEDNWKLVYEILRDGIRIYG